MKVFRWWVVVLVVTPAAMHGCNGTDTPPVAVGPPPGSMPDSMMLICPKIWDWTVYRRTDRDIGLHRYGDFARFLPDNLPEGETRMLPHGESVLVQIDTVFLSGPGETQNTAEFHDCQAFAISRERVGRAAYSDGIFAVFAVRRGSDATSSELLFREAAGRGEALPAAQVFALASYPPLGIQEGYSCLFLLQRGDRFQARMRGDGWVEKDCRSPIPASEFLNIPIPEGGTLSVTYVDPRPQDPDTIPMVARWHWHFDEEQRTHIYGLGVWCDQWWCRVENSGTTTPWEPFAWDNITTANFARGNPIIQTHQGNIPGWYDEQILAVYSDQTLRVSAVVGTIIPEDNLGLYEDAHFANSTWLPAAKVALRPIDGRWTQPGTEGAIQDPFIEKFNLDLTPSQGPLNTISLCRGTWARCMAGEPAADLELVPKLHHDQIHVDDDDEWWAKFEGLPNSGRDPIYRRVARCPYNFQVAGTARWRWLPDDPGIWVRCIEGCCEVRGNGKR